MEKHYFLQSGKRVQQTRQIQTKTGWVNYFFSKLCFTFIGFPCSFWLEFCEHRKITFSVTKLNVTKVGNRVQQTRVLAKSKWTPKVIFCKILVHFHWLFESFPIANSGNRKCHLVTMKTTISEGQKTQKVAWKNLRIWEYAYRNLDARPVTE